MPLKSVEHGALLPGLGIDPGGVALLPGDAIEKELDKIEFEALQMEAYLDAVDLNYHGDVEVDINHYFPDLYTDDSESDDSSEAPIDISPLGPEETLETYNYGDGHDWNTAVIGGAVVSNIRLVVASEKTEEYADLPVAIIQGSMGMHAQILAPNPKGTSLGKQQELPILMLPGGEKISSSIQDLSLSNLKQLPPFATTISGLLNAPTEGAQTSIGTEAAVNPIASDTTVGKAELENYVLSGDIKNFFGIKGLKAKLYKYNGPVQTMDESEDEKTDKKPEPAREKVMLDPNSYELLGQPLRALFPFLESVSFKDLPIESLQFTYSEEEETFLSLFPPGLRLNVDVLLEGGLQWAGDLLKNLFGQHTPPTSIHLSAHISKERDWSKRPNVENLVLKGEFRNLTLKPWDFLKFMNMGIELTATHSVDKSSNDKDKEKKSWNFGFGLYGNLMITKIPHANAPLFMKYRIARDFVPGKDEEENKEEGSKEEESEEEESKEEESKEEEEKDDEDSKKAGNDDDSKHKRLWKLVISCDKWENIYGVKNITMTKAELMASFEEGDFKETLQLKLSAKMMLGEGTFDITGKISANDNFINAKIGDLELSKIKRIYEQVSGQKSPIKDNEPTSKDEDEAAGNKLIFKELSLKLSSTKRKKDKTTLTALELDGQVTFNDRTSANAKLRIGTDGLKIEGGIEDFQVPDTHVIIQKAGLSIFIAFKQNGNKAIAEDENAGDDFDSETNESEDIELIDSGAHKSYQLVCQEVTFRYLNRMSVENRKENSEQFSAEISAEVEKAWLKEKSKQGKPKESKNNESKDIAMETGKDISKKKPKKPKKKEYKRETTFQILGVIEIGTLKIGMGIHYARKKGQKENSWLVFGSVGNIVLSKIWPQLETTFLNLQLTNVAFIASSEARQKKWKDGGKIEPEKGKEKIEKDETEADGDDEVEKTASWDVLKQVESYGYPIVEGIQICATVSRFEQLKGLNNGDDVDGLVLIVSIASNGTMKISIELPSSFAMHMGDYAKFGDFGAAISVGKDGAQLDLTAILTMYLDNQLPLRVKGIISAGPLTGKGELFMTEGSKWINPFGLSKEIVISKLGGSMEIEWANVLTKGPKEIAIRGKLSVADFTAQIALCVGIGITRNQQLFYIEISRIDIAAIVRLAGDITGNSRLPDVKGDVDALVFSKLKVYFSTGASIFETYYKRGIHVAGTVTFFDKTGDFSGSFNDEGLDIIAGLDNFKIGGLEVKSTRAAEGVERATMKIEMTPARQKIFIDGMIQCHDFELKILIEADLQQRRFYADVSIKFTESLSIALKAVAEVKNPGSLAGILVEFEAELKLDIFGEILEGINTAIKTLETLATTAIEEAEAKIQRDIGVNQVRIQNMKIELKRMRDKADQDVAIRMKEVEAGNRKLKKARNELDRLERAVEVAEINFEKHKDGTNTQIAKRDAAQRKLTVMIRERTGEYEHEINTEKSKQFGYQRRQKELEDERDARFGDAMRDYRNVENYWNEGQKKIANLDSWKHYCGRMWTNAHWTKRPYWGALQAGAAMDLEFLKGQIGVDTGVFQALHALHSLPGFKAFEGTLENIAGDLNKIGMSIHKLQTKGVVAFVQELTRNEEAERDYQIRTLQIYYAKSKQLENVLKKARNLLNENQGRLTKEEEDAQGQIIMLKRDINMDPFEDAYKLSKMRHDHVVSETKIIQDTLKDVKAVVKGGAQITREVTDMLKMAVPRVTKIYVKASTDVFNNKKKPLIFEISAEWKGEKSFYRVEWVPGSEPADLYRDVASKLVTKGQPIPTTNIPISTSAPASKSTAISAEASAGVLAGTPKSIVISAPTSKPVATSTITPTSKPTAIETSTSRSMARPIAKVSLRNKERGSGMNWSMGPGTGFNRRNPRARFRPDPPASKLIATGFVTEAKSSDAPEFPIDISALYAELTSIGLVQLAEIEAAK